jgi:hypothetical protein
MTDRPVAHDRARSGQQIVDGMPTRAMTLKSGALDRPVHRSITACNGARHNRAIGMANWWLARACHDAGSAACRCSGFTLSL